MASHYDVARQLLTQRNQLLAELQAARRENDQLRGRQETFKIEEEGLKRRVASTEEEAQALRDQLAVLTERAQAEQERPLIEPDNAELLAPLNRRIQELTRDLDRLQRRTAETVTAARREERVRLLSGLGDVLDSVVRALALDDTDDTQGPWRQGLEAIHSQLLSYMRGEGAVMTGEVGQELDPRVHQAIAVVDTPDFSPGQIVRVDRQGIELEGGTLVRPALVVVAR